MFQFQVDIITVVGCSVYSPMPLQYLMTCNCSGGKKIRYKEAIGCKRAGGFFYLAKALLAL